MQYYTCQKKEKCDILQKIKKVKYAQMRCLYIFGDTMKKIFILLLALVMLLPLTFTACNQAESTGTVVRWEEATYHFNVTLADFNSEENGYNVYPVSGVNYYKDFAISSTAEKPSNKDEVLPDRVVGSYEMKITMPDDGANTLLVTTQTLYVRYEKSVIESSKNAEELKTKIADASEDPFIGEEDAENYVTLKSTTDTSVKFVNKSGQHPIESSTSVDGFYIGKTEQQLSKYSVSTKYDFEKNIATVTLNEGTPVENKIKTNNKNFIDANQLLLYVRSFEKTSSKFNDSPTVLVYSPMDNKTYTGAFVFSYQANCILPNGEENAYVKLNSINVYLDSMPYLQQQNLPASLAEKGLDCILENPKYTTTRFRVGYLAYQLSDADVISADVISALTAE